MKVAFIDFVFENEEMIKLNGCEFMISSPFENQDRLIHFSRECDILCGRDQFLKWDKYVISSLPNLKCIITRSTGYDHIDWKYASENKIPVYNVPGYGRNTVAEFAIGLALNVMRKIPQFSMQYVERDYSIDGLMGFDLKNKTAGILGTGAIGQEMIKICKGFSMKIIAHDLQPDTELGRTLGFEYVSLDELLRHSDLLSIHIPLSDSTYHMIDENAIGKMKRSAVIVNTGRGEIIHTESLIEALRAGKIYGAGLDVIEGERKKTFDFRGLNAIVTTHIAWYTEEAIARITEISMSNIQSFLNGEFTNCVNMA
jgi:D-lactate dehydrogenase